MVKTPIKSKTKKKNTPGTSNSNLQFKFRHFETNNQELIIANENSA